MPNRTWTVKTGQGCLEIRQGNTLVARCYTKANACLVVSAPMMARALAKAEQVLLKANRHKDGSQLQNTRFARVLAEDIAPALDAARGKTNGRKPRRVAARSKRTGLPVQRV